MEQIVRCYSEVVSQLPGSSKRRIFSTAFPHLYTQMKQNPLLIEFVRNIVMKAKNTHYTSIVLIDFIANHMDVAAAGGRQP